MGLFRQQFMTAEQMQPPFNEIFGSKPVPTAKQVKREKI
jgi:hypothetical protein